MDSKALIVSVARVYELENDTFGCSEWFTTEEAAREVYARTRHQQGLSLFEVSIHLPLAPTAQDLVELLNGGATKMRQRERLIATSFCVECGAVNAEDATIELCGACRGGGGL